MKDSVERAFRVVQGGHTAGELGISGRLRRRVLPRFYLESRTKGPSLGNEVAPIFVVLRSRDPLAELAEVPEGGREHGEELTRPAVDLLGGRAGLTREKRDELVGRRGRCSTEYPSPVAGMEANQQPGGSAQRAEQADHRLVHDCQILVALESGAP
jgi:hypothetical protein